MLSALMDALLLAVVALSCSPVWAGDWPNLVNVTSPLTLATEPACGSLNGTNFTDINAGINLNATRTIVAFGDSWTSNGANGTVPVAPVMHPPLPSAGSQFNENRRASNGFIWVEDLANTLNSKLLNYAWGGAVIDNAAYNTTNPAVNGTPRTDFNDEASLFFLQGKYLDSLEPSQTLYTVAFGINDDGQFELGGGDYDIAYNTYVNRLGELQASGAQNILVHGMYKSHTGTDELQNRIFAYLRDAHTVNGTNVAFVNLQTLFGAINATASAFGYTGNGTSTCLLSADTTEGGCDDPDTQVFYIPGHPSSTTHELISLYTLRVVEVCGF